MRKFAKNWPFPFLILLVTLFIAFKNYTPGTWLLGWDNLAPELNFKLNIARSLSAVWQEYQGVGLLGGMAHAAELPRQIILAGLSSVIPTALIRYFWTFLMLMVGPLGVYFLVRNVLIYVKTTSLRISLAAFASAVFYIFNLATVQTFFTPFETFISFFGFFPWLLSFGGLYLRSGKKRDLIFFAVISILATSAFYVQTLFVVYVVFLVVLAIEGIIRYKKDGLIRTLKLALVTIFINAFWLLPATYFTITNAGVTQTSHINSIATPETKIMNQARSGSADIATLKGYWFDYYDWDNSGNYKLLYQDWINYGKNPLVGKVSLALFAVSVVGLVLIFFKRRNVFGVSLIFLLGISYFMLSGGIVPGFPILNEAFRNVFTKWANAAALIYAVGLGFFVYTVSGIIKNNLKYIPGVILSGLIIGGGVFTVLPVFQGKLIAESMKVEPPSYYTDTINYFKNIDSTKRIAGFPLTDFWGWKFNDWGLPAQAGYRGSGFLWYGVPQPVLDRAFDVWSSYNEQFYNEADYVVSWGTVADLERVFTKYQVSYVVFDESIFMPGNESSTAQLLKQKNFLESSSLISKEKTFGKITIYKIGIPEVDNFVGVSQTDYSEPIYRIGPTGNLFIRETFSDDQGYKEAKNCNIDEKGSVVKLKQNGGNYYEAENDGVSCDYFYYPNLDYSKAYTMRIKGENLSGRSLRFYLYNVKGEKIYMNEILPEGAFDKTYTIFPTGSSEDEGYGYTLSVETRSFGKIKSENLITAIEFYDLQVEKNTFKGTTLQGVYSILQDDVWQNNLQILSVKKYGTWGYRVRVERRDGDGLLVLGQGYEDGWKAFPTRNYQLSIFNFQLNLQIPIFKQELEHTEVNSWANGWLVPKSNIQDSRFQILVVFWPQLLEWGGLLLGGITLLVLILPGRKK